MRMSDISAIGKSLECGKSNPRLISHTTGNADVWKSPETMKTEESR